MKWTQESKVWLLTLIVGILGIIEGKVGVIFPADWLPYIETVGQVVALIGALLKISPLPREQWSTEKRITEATKKIVGMLVIVAVASAGCHQKPLNIQTNPVGTVAHYATQVTNIVQGVQDALIAAEAAKIPGVTAERIAPGIRATMDFGKQAQKLAAALTELDALPIGDLTRPTKIKAIGVALASMQAIAFNMIIPVGDDPLLIKIRDLVREVSVLLLTVQQQLQPPVPDATVPSARLHRPGWLWPVLAQVPCPIVA